MLYLGCHHTNTRRAGRRIDWGFDTAADSVGAVVDREKGVVKGAMVAVVVRVVPGPI